MSWIQTIQRLWQSPPLPSVTFATACWEMDWRTILLDPDYLRLKQIGHHLFPFAEKLLIINNVGDLPAVIKAAETKIQQGVLTRLVIADDLANETLSSLHLSKQDFSSNPLHPTVTSDWLYYNALAPLTAIHAAESPYLLYLTGDVYLEKPVSWIPQALRLMEKHPNYKVANLTWNQNYKEAKKESYASAKNFYLSRIGFSDQLFLIKKNDFHQPIYHQIRSDTAHVPRGDVFERRVLSYMKNQGWDRLTYKKGSYTHK